MRRGSSAAADDEAAGEIAASRPPRNPPLPRCLDKLGAVDLGSSKWRTASLEVAAMPEHGRIVGDYEVVGELQDRGGMSVVFMARQLRLGRKAALKQVDLRLG